MKGRRNFVVAILLVAIMCIGVGFAVLDSDINGTGKITYDPAFDIQWTETVTGDKVVSGDTSVTTTDHTNDTLAFTVDTSDMAVNETTTVTATVKNDLKYDAKNVKVQDLITTAVSDYYNVTVVLQDNADTIAAGGTLNVIITIKMTAYPKVYETFNANFTFKVYAEQDV